MRGTRLYQRPQRTPTWPSLSRQRQGLVAWWPLSEPTGAAVFNAITGKTAALTGATWKPDDIGYCVDCSGSSQYVVLGQQSLAGSATLAMWLNMDQWLYAGNAAGLGGIFGRGQWGADGNGDIRITTLDVGGNLRVQATTSSGDYEAAYSTLNLSTGRWYHICGVYDEAAAFVYLYVNGVRVASTSTAGSMSDAAKNFVAGGYPNNESNTEINGRFADLRIYDRALSYGEIRELWAPETRWRLYETNPVLWMPTSVSGISGTSAVIAPAATLTASGTVVNAYTGTSAVTAAAATMAATGTVVNPAAGFGSNFQLLGIG